MKSFRWIALIAISIVAIHAWSKPFTAKDSYEVIESNYYPTHTESHATQTTKHESEADPSISPPMLVERLNTLQQEIYQLQGQLELQARELQQIRQQQQTFYQTMEHRLANIETSASTVTQTATDSKTVTKTASPTSASHSNNPAAEQAAYVAAYEWVRNKNYPQAIKAMKIFIERYPESQYAANAHYWLGELYLVEQQLKQSVTEFETVLNQFPSSTKAAPAMLKLGYAYLGLGEDRKARQQLQKVQQQFPGSHAARLAATRLKEMS